MQTLTIPASVAKRKQACKSCRQRKKKCDAEHPICSFCKKWGNKCEYTIPDLSSINNTPLQDRAIEPSVCTRAELPLDFDFIQTDVPDFMQFPGMNFDLTSTLMPLADQVNEYLTPGSGPGGTMLSDGTLNLQQDVLGDFQLPPVALLIELVELFFQHSNHMFPCFHRGSFIEKVQCGSMEKEAPLLLYAICCTAAKYHPDRSVKSRAKDWYEQARFSYELTRRRPYPGLRTLQAVLLLVVHAYTIGDFSASWLFLGKAWRQVVVLGMNRMDASHAVAMGLSHPNADAGQETYYGLENSEAKTAVEAEEYRRTLWLLFMMDRTHAWPTGWPNAIPEIQFKVDIPVADTLFQAMDPALEESLHDNIPFSRNAGRLISSLTTAKDPLNLFHYIAIAHVLLGRVAELIHSLHNPPDTAEYAEECAELDALIVKLRLSIPRKASSIVEATPADRGHVVWLHVTLNIIAILLYFRRDDDFSTSQFTLAVTAARSIAQIIKDASRISIDLLLSAHTASALYVAACVLVIQWRMTGDETLKQEVDLFELVFDRMDEVFSFLGLKFRLALEHDLKRSETYLASLKERGFRGLLADCSKWDFVKDEAKRRGIAVDLS